MPLAFTAARAEFATAVGQVATFVQTEPRRGTRAYWAGPVMRGILLTSENGAVSILGSDLEQTGRAVIPAETTGRGPALVDAGRLAGICLRLAGGTVTVELHGSVLHICGGAARFRLLTMPEWDYPEDIPQPSPMARVRPVRVDGRTGGEKLLESVRQGLSVTMKHKPYAPQGLAPGAWITWARVASTGEVVEVSGRVWDTARGKRAVWAIAEGERPVRVEERTYGRGTFAGGDYERHTRLEEVPVEVPDLSAYEVQVVERRHLVA